MSFHLIIVIHPRQPAFNLARTGPSDTCSPCLAGLMLCIAVCNIVCPYIMASHRLEEAIALFLARGKHPALISITTIP